MAIILIGAVSSFLTWLAGKTKVSKTYLSMALCIILGAGYYFATKYYNVQWEQLVEVIGGVYASSQVIYNLAVKFGLLEKWQ
jgi:hypothetical protein